MEAFLFKDKKQDLLILFLIAIFAIVFSSVFQTSFLVSTLLFLGLPSFYLCFKEEKFLPKILLASVSFGLFFGFCFDFIAELNNAWSWNGGLYFGKILGIVQIDVMIWFFLWVFHILVFYEHFADKDKSKYAISKHSNTVFLISFLAVCILLLVYTFSPHLLIVYRAYLWLSVIANIPLLIVFFYKPRLVFHVIKIMPYFFFIYLSHEITALYLSQWSFPGHYIGWVHLLGVQFPIEEMIFWITFSSVTAALYYEVSFDNGKN
jgi:hypothetical protein